MKKKHFEQNFENLELIWQLNDENACHGLTFLVLIFLNRTEINPSLILCNLTTWSYALTFLSWVYFKTSNKRTLFIKSYLHWLLINSSFSLFPPLLANNSCTSSSIFYAYPSEIPNSSSQETRIGIVKCLLKSVLLWWER